MRERVLALLVAALGLAMIAPARASWDPWQGQSPLAWQWPIWERRYELLAPGGPRDVLLACGPRSGKDVLSTALVLDLAVELQVDRIAAGSDLNPLVHVWVTAPTSDDFAQVWREYRARSRGLRRIVSEERGREKLILNFTDAKRPEETGIVIEFKSAWQPQSDAGGHGKRLVGVGLDIDHRTEWAGFSQSADDNIDDRRISPSRAGISIRNGTPTLSPSRNYREMFLRGKAEPVAWEEDASGIPASIDPQPITPRVHAGRMLFANVPTWANEALGPEELRQLVALLATKPQRRRDAFQGAKLVAGGSRIFPGLHQVARGTIEPGRRGIHYVKGWDLAGKGSDFNAVCIYRIEPSGRPVQVMVDRWNDLRWGSDEELGDTTERRIVRLCKEYPGELHFDTTGRIAAPARIRALLRGTGEIIRGDTFTQPAKASWVEHAQAWIESGRVVLLAKDAGEHTEAQLQEFQDYREIVTQTGHVSYRASEGSTDDIVSADLIALWACRSGARTGTRDAIMAATGGVW